jgi:hypothetical protein
VNGVSYMPLVGWASLALLSVWVERGPTGLRHWQALEPKRVRCVTTASIGRQAKMRVYVGQLTRLDPRAVTERISGGRPERGPQAVSTWKRPQIFQRFWIRYSDWELHLCGDSCSIHLRRRNVTRDATAVTLLERGPDDNGPLSTPIH